MMKPLRSMFDVVDRLFRSTLGRPCVFPFIPVLAGLLALALFGGRYLTMDEIDMRAILEGSAGDGSVGPYPFVVYGNVLFGYVVSYLYRIAPSVYWYDLVTYFSLSASFAVLAHGLRGVSTIRNVLVLLILSGLSALFYTIPQFTITTGFLSVSATFSFFLSSHDNVKNRMAWVLYALGAWFLASLIRFNACAVVSIFSGCVFLISGRFRLAVVLRRGWFVGCVAVGLVAIGYCADRVIVRKVEYWNSLRRLNAAKAALTDKTTLWSHVWSGCPWRGLETIDCQVKDSVFSTEDYRLLLCFASIGNQDVINADNLERVTKAIGCQVQNHTLEKFQYRFGDSCGVYGYLVMLWLGLIMCAGPSARRCALMAIVFVVTIATLNYYFRPPPIHLWLNFAFAVIVSELLIACDSVIYNRDKCLYAGVYVLCACCCLSMVRYAGRKNYQIREIADSYIDATLPSKYHYIMDYSAADYMAYAFCPNPNTGRSVFVMSALMKSEANNRLEEKWGVSSDTWRKICAKDSKIRFIRVDNGWQGQFTALCRAVAFYLNRKYGLKMIVCRERISEGISLYQFKAVENAHDEVVDATFVDDSFVLEKAKDMNSD